MASYDDIQNLLRLLAQNKLQITDPEEMAGLAQKLSKLRLADLSDITSGITPEEFQVLNQTPFGEFTGWMENPLGMEQYNSNSERSAALKAFYNRIGFEDQRAPLVSQTLHDGTPFPEDYSQMWDDYSTRKFLTPEETAIGKALKAQIDADDTYNAQRRRKGLDAIMGRTNGLVPDAIPQVSQSPIADIPVESSPELIQELTESVQDAPSSAGSRISRSPLINPYHKVYPNPAAGQLFMTGDPGSEYRAITSRVPVNALGRMYDDMPVSQILPMLDVGTRKERDATADYLMDRYNFLSDDYLLDALDRDPLDPTSIVHGEAPFDFPQRPSTVSPPLFGRTALSVNPDSIPAPQRIQRTVSKNWHPKARPTQIPQTVPDVPDVPGVHEMPTAQVLQMLEQDASVLDGLNSSGSGLGATPPAADPVAASRNPRFPATRVAIPRQKANSRMADVGFERTMTPTGRIDLASTMASQSPDGTATARPERTIDFGARGTTTVDPKKVLGGVPDDLSDILPGTEAGVNNVLGTPMGTPPRGTAPKRGGLLGMFDDFFGQSGRGGVGTDPKSYAKAPGTNGGSGIFGRLFAPELSGNLKGIGDTLGNPQFNYTAGTGLKGWGKNLGGWYTGIKGGADAIGILNNLSDSAKEKTNTQDLQSDILTAAMSNPMSTYSLTSDQLKLLGDIRAGRRDEGADFSDFDMGAGLKGAITGALTGLPGGWTGAILGGLGGFAKEGTAGLAAGQQRRNAELEALYQTLNASNVDYKNAMRQRMMQRYF